MSDTTTDAAIARIAAAVAAHEGRYRWVQVATTDVAALLAEVTRLRAERDKYRDALDIVVNPDLSSDAVDAARRALGVDVEAQEDE